jgi:hypothetical protein
MPYEDDLRNEGTISTVVWSISLSMFAAAAAIIMWFAIATH